MADHAESQNRDPESGTGATPPGTSLDRQSLLDQLRDVNEQLVVSSMRAQELADQADAARGDAETANRLKDEFLATVSHELRTPLSAILGSAHLLESGQLDPARTTSAIRVIARNAKASARIIDDLLDVSRIIHGDVRLDRLAVDLSVVIQEALDALRLAAQDKAIDMTFIGSAAPPPSPVTRFV
jgi:signal transduction histidine kinase